MTPVQAIPAVTPIEERGYAHPELLVSTDWVAQHLDDPKVRLVESNEDLLLYDTGHIPGAVKVDWTNDLNDQVIRDYIDRERIQRLLRSKGIDKDTTIVFYGDKNNWWATSFARVLPPLLGGLSLAVGPLVAWAMPSYVPAIAPARLFLLAGAAMGLVNLASLGAIAAGRQRQLPLYAITALALTLGLSLLALASGYGLGGVAGAAFAGHLLYAAAVVRVNVRETGLPDSDRFVMLTLLPLIYCTVAVIAAGAVFPGTDPASGAMALGAYLLLILPLLPSLRGEWRRVVRRRN